MSRLLAALLVVTFASSAEPALGASRVIVAFGDSLTAGLGLSPEEAYPALLEARLAHEGYDYRVVNAGVSGDTSAGGLRRIDWALKLGPEIVIVALGANDGLRGLPPTAMRDNLLAIVQRARNAGARVLLAGMQLPPNYGTSYARSFEKVFADVAQTARVPLIPFLLEGVGGEARLNLPDGIHPNAEGQRRIAEHVWPYLQPLLTKTRTPRGAAR
ncbi:MAG TPA: arylesterase [Methylomirabilota bacterium]|nr:arylesterase [Methylomirabilota bacterium]